MREISLKFSSIYCLGFNSGTSLRDCY